MSVETLSRRDFFKKVAVLGAAGFFEAGTRGFNLPAVASDIAERGNSAWNISVEGEGIRDIDGEKIDVSLDREMFVSALFLLAEKVGGPELMEKVEHSLRGSFNLKLFRKDWDDLLYRGQFIPPNTIVINGEVINELYSKYNGSLPSDNIDPETVILHEMFHTLQYLGDPNFVVNRTLYGLAATTAGLFAVLATEKTQREVGKMLLKKFGREDHIERSRFLIILKAMCFSYFFMTGFSLIDPVHRGLERDLPVYISEDPNLVLLAGQCIKFKEV